VISSNPQFYDV